MTTTYNYSEYSPGLIQLMVGFKDVNDELGDVDEPKVHITSFVTGSPITVDALGVVLNPDHSYTLSPLTPPVEGTYKFSFLTTGMKPGLYSLNFTGKIEEVRGMDTIVHTRSVPGVIEIGPLSLLDALINRVVSSLMDDCPELYRLDEPVAQWDRGNIYNFIIEALQMINITGPRQTNYSLDSIPPNLETLLVQGARVFAMYARARLEKANEMNYSDVHSLQINRADFYKSLAESFDKQWKDAIQGWKKSTPPTPMGIRSQRVPFRISRVIGLLPNYQAYFSG